MIVTMRSDFPFLLGDVIVLDTDLEKPKPEPINRWRIEAMILSQAKDSEGIVRTFAEYSISTVDRFGSHRHMRISASAARPAPSHEE